MLWEKRGFEFYIRILESRLKSGVALMKTSDVNSDSKLTDIRIA